ncbi:MAG TPA: hypothetical protein VKS60_00280 [Stellaceae bacterium]|nr:hypothetical protein [Stellaceae bacterium]
MSEVARITSETIGLMRTTLSQDDELLAKAGWTAPGSFPTGIQSWPLEAPAKSLFPVLTPLRNRIPRMLAEGGVQANWKAITGINTSLVEPGVSDGNRGGAIVTATADYNAIFREYGLEDYVTWAAYLSASGFMDLNARAQTNLLWALMIAEEFLDLGGNRSLALGTGNRPTVADIGTGGTLAAATTYSVIVVPLSLQGLRAATVAGGVPGSITRSNVDGTSDTYGGGSGRPSTNRTVTTANDGNATHSISATTAATNGAFGYAWFWGAAGSETLGAITTINSVVITGAAAGTQLASALTADNSTNSLVYDGIMTQALSGLGSYVAVQPTGTAGTGTPLTADGVGGVVEIDAALQGFWDNYRLSPDNIWVSSQEQRNITKKVLQGSANAAQRFIINVEQGNIKGGDLVTAYLNKFAMNGAKSIAVRLHPNMPPGTILFDSETLPYPLSNVTDILVKRLRRDYNSTMWPPRTRKYEFGVYCDGVLQNYFPPAFGVITNIGNG